jgi:dienelactone hydrolase
VQVIARPLGVALGAVVIAAGLLAGCSSPSAFSVVSAARVAVTPESSLFDQPVDLVVSDLGPGRPVTVGLRSVDAKGTVWTSSAVFLANGSGAVDLATAAGVGGSYHGVDPMGLIDAMQPTSGQATLYYWNPGAPQRFQLTVTEAGATVATAAFSRRAAAPGVTVSSESIAATGFFGQFWKPPAGSPPRPGVLEFGGSEGGLSGQLLGSALASAGYPTLDIAYFGEPGLPSELKDIPLEYFARALRWLGRQPGVLAGQTYVSGVSRGSEAALLLGVYYPGLVHGIIAASPNDVALCSYPGCRGAAWTLRGRPLPYTNQPDEPYPTDNPAAVIPVQKIRGPVFLACGTADLLWTSCAFAQAVQGRLNAAGDRYPHVLYRYQGAGHGVGSLVPYEPFSSSYAALNAESKGDAPLANTDAAARLWPQLLDFLADPAGRRGTFTAPATPPPLGTR